MLKIVTSLQFTLDQVVVEQASQTKLLNKILTRAGPRGPEDPVQDHDFDLPLETLGDVQRLEQSLQDQAIKNALVSTYM